MYLETPKRFRSLASQAHRIAGNHFRPISRKHDKAEHTCPKELDLFAALLDDMSSGSPGAVSTTSASKRAGKQVEEGVKNGGNLPTLLGMMELCQGGAGLLLTMPHQGLSNAAIAAVTSEEQLQRFGGTWATMAITEPDCGSGSAAIHTTATQDGDHYVLNGEKIFVTSGERADAVVVWATLNCNLGRAAIKSFVIEKGTPGMAVMRPEEKLGIKASDATSISFNDCRVPAASLLGSVGANVQKGFAGIMETFDNTRPLMTGITVGVVKAALGRTRELLKRTGCRFDCRKPLLIVNHAEATLYRLEAEWEAARLLTLETAWMADNKLPNSEGASIARAKAGRVANETTLECVELVGALSYAEDELLKKWARDPKILDIFEDTQQIQLLIVARHLLGKSSSQLK